MASNSIALCLSGGGLRATLFHLGLIKALRAHRMGEGSALAAVDEIYSVSGGSILAAHLVKNWAAYNGDDAQFAKMETQLLAFARSNIRDRIVRRWLLTRWMGRHRSDWLQGEYRALLGRGSIKDCYRQEPCPPKLYILATSFKTGELCSFDHQSFEIVRRTPNGPSLIATPGGHLGLAYAVAASSAFPPLFPPIPLTHDMLGNPESDEFLLTTYLSDGGVFDNLGFEKLRLNRGRTDPQPDMIITSNAGASFRADPSNRFRSILSRNIRASDILMRRVGDTTEDSVRSVTDAVHVPVWMNATIDTPDLDPATQQRLRAVRTDLDRFDGDLAGLLIDHGCRVGSAALTAKGWTAATPLQSLMANRDRTALDAVAAKAARRQTWSLLFDFRDWKTVPILWSLVALVIAGGLLTILQATRTRISQGNTLAFAEKLREASEAYQSGNQAALEQVLAQGNSAAQAIEADPDRSLAADPVIVAAPPPVTYQVQQASVKHPQRVYIQFAGNLTREQITGLNRGLRAAGWAAQGSSGERTVIARDQNEIRWGGTNEALALELKAAIDATGITKPLGLRRVDSVRDTLELWISN